MRIGVFGGTFDPPHIAHLVLAAEARAQLELERILWVLTPHPPHKPDHPITSVELRLKMLRGVLNDDPAFEISRVDLDRPQPHYALDTMRLLREQLPADTLVYLMGGDSLNDLPNWHEPQQFLAACDAIGVMLRPGSVIDIPILERDLPGLGEKVLFVGTPLLEISSSDIRKRIAQQRHFRYYLSPPVYRMIVKGKMDLYRD